MRAGGWATAVISGRMSLRSEGDVTAPYQRLPPPYRRAPTTERESMRQKKRAVARKADLGRNYEEGERSRKRRSSRRPARRTRRRAVAAGARARAGSDLRLPPRRISNRLRGSFSQSQSLELATDTVGMNGCEKVVSPTFYLQKNVRFTKTGFRHTHGNSSNRPFTRGILYCLGYGATDDEPLCWRQGDWREGYGRPKCDDLSVRVLCGFIHVGVNVQQRSCECTKTFVLTFVPGGCRRPCSRRIRDKRTTPHAGRGWGSHRAAGKKPGTGIGLAYLKRNNA